jgi:hypothetical protein
VKTINKLNPLLTLLMFPDANWSPHAHGGSMLDHCFDIVVLCLLVLGFPGIFFPQVQCGIRCVILFLKVEAKDLHIRCAKHV